MSPQKSRRIKESLYGLMRLAFFFGFTEGSVDFVIGVHPRHARFYRRAFGFQQVGSERQYPMVRHQPVVLLHGSLKTSLQMRRVPYVLDHCLSNPVSPDAYKARYRFHRHVQANPSVIAEYFEYKQFGGAGISRCRPSAA